MNKNNHFADLGKMVARSRNKLIAEYSETVITVPASERWNYALPQNYKNFQDGFLYQVVESHRGMPMLEYEDKILYLHRALDCFCEELQAFSECLLCFDRSGNKYCFRVLKDSLEEGVINPSYCEFIKRVKPYTPSHRDLYNRRKNNA